jgi:hypothetical protein
LNIFPLLVAWWNFSLSERERAHNNTGFALHGGAFCIGDVPEYKPFGDLRSVPKADRLR